jgi:predicted Fe-Mo cluster-binding NifX family protein
MRLGIPDWDGTVSPVFDVAGQLLVLDIHDGRETGRRLVSLGAGGAADRARRLSDLGVDTLVCGTISRSLEAMITHRGVRVMALVTGPVDQVARSVIGGERLPASCLLPGCRRPRVRRPTATG